MRGKGISYDTGFVSKGRNAREPFDPEVVKRELQIIRDDLHCNAVRVMGGDPERLELAATYAADLGLEVWFSPYPLELTTDEMLSLFADCAERAERLRRRGAEVVFVTGAELSLMNKGFLPGDTFGERVELLNEPHRLRALIPEVAARVNEFLAKAAALVRERFGGKITYAAIQHFEGVDWTRFDMVSVDLYRSIEVADRFADGVRALVAQGKPVAITEFGAATFHGASDRGARGLEIVEYDKDTGAPVRLNGEYPRDEEGQARYLLELLEIFEAGGVDSTFVFAFALHGYLHRPDGDPRQDLDLASYGIVKVFEDRHGQAYPDMAWEPKAAFRMLADYYSKEASMEGGTGRVTIETLQRLVDAFNAHDVDAVMGFFTDDPVLELPRGPDPWGRRFQGRAQVRAGLASRFAGIPDVHYGDDRHWVSGDRGCSEWLLTGTTPQGERIEVRGCDLFEFKGDKIARKDSYWKLVER